MPGYAVGGKGYHEQRDQLWKRAELLERRSRGSGWGGQRRRSHFSMTLGGFGGRGLCERSGQRMFDTVNWTAGGKQLALTECGRGHCAYGGIACVVDGIAYVVGGFVLGSGVGLGGDCGTWCVSGWVGTQWGRVELDGEGDGLWYRLLYGNRDVLPFITNQYWYYLLMGSAEGVSDRAKPYASPCPRHFYSNTKNAQQKI